MYLNSGCLPHLLPPRAYWCPEYYERERDLLLWKAWHLVATTAELARPGDFVTLDLLGVPIQVRNFHGRLRALSNVCAHRHCLLSDQPRGHSPTLVCQYHGWEYGASGNTRKIPGPDNFVPFPQVKPCLQGYRLDTAGSLVFVNLAQEGPGLAEHLGPLHGRCVERFGADWECSWSWDPAYPANWKIPVENSLEAYHVPCVHPNTFKEDPGEARSVHALEPRYTAFTTRLPFAHTPPDRLLQNCESWIVERLGRVPSEEYSQHHVFPNLLFSFTDTLSFCQCVVPTSATTSRAVVRQFGPAPGSVPFWHRFPLLAWNRLKGAVSSQILREDRSIFTSIQKGLNASTHAGLLGRCEERIHAFQQYVAQSLCSDESLR